MDLNNLFKLLFFLFAIFVLKLLSDIRQSKNSDLDQKKFDSKITLDSFKLRSSLMNSNERIFFEQLKIAVGEKYDIYPQVHLGAIFQPVNFRHNWAEINKLNKKIDFVLFDKNTQSSKIAIELDGYSHSNPKSFDRDKFVDAIFAKFNIPLVRFNNGNYSVEEIKSKLTIL